MTKQETSLNTPFLRKLSNILTNQLYYDIIRWDQTGTMIDIFDQKTIESDILPKFFRHAKFESFVRQLNLYGFRKMKKKTSHRFRHPDLVKGNSLFSIKSQRKFKHSTQKLPSIQKSFSQQSQIAHQDNSPLNNDENGPLEKNDKLNQIQTRGKIENNIFNFIANPFDCQPIFQNPFYLNQVNYCQAFNPTSNYQFHPIYLPPTNNILFYN